MGNTSTQQATDVNVIVNQGIGLLEQRINSEISRLMYMRESLKRELKLSGEDITESDSLESIADFFISELEFTDLNKPHLAIMSDWYNFYGDGLLYKDYHVQSSHFSQTKSLILRDKIVQKLKHLKIDLVVENDVHIDHGYGLKSDVIAFYPAIRANDAKILLTRALDLYFNGLNLEQFDNEGVTYFVPRVRTLPSAPALATLAPPPEFIMD